MTRHAQERVFIEQMEAFSKFATELLSKGEFGADEKSIRMFCTYTGASFGSPLVFAFMSYLSGYNAGKAENSKAV